MASVNEILKKFRATQGSGEAAAPCKKPAAAKASERKAPAERKPSADRKPRGGSGGAGGSSGGGSGGSRPRVGGGGGARGGAAASSAAAAATALGGGQLSAQGRQQLPAAMALAAEAKRVADRQAAAQRTRQGAPMGKLVKDVIKELRKADGQPLTSSKLEADANVDLAGHPTLLQALRLNDKVLISGGPDLDSMQFTYRPTHDIRNCAQLLAFVRKRKQGVLADEVEDAYASVMEDVQRLKAQRQLMVLFSVESGSEVLYPCDERYASVRVDDDIVKEWHAHEVPRDPIELEIELRRAGLKPAPRRAARRRLQAPEKKKKRKQQAPRVITNVHMPELFQDPPPAPAKP